MIVELMRKERAKLKRGFLVERRKEREKKKEKKRRERQRDRETKLDVGGSRRGW